MKTDTRKTPERIVRMAAGTPEIDVEARTVRSDIVTLTLARDGGILVPEGINVRYYEQNPVVQAMHGSGLDSHSPVIGRAMGLTVTRSGMQSVTRFADTELGREYAYLYGCNEQKEVFCRAWSFGWRNISVDWIAEGEAKEMLGASWDPDAYAASPFERVWVCRKAEMLEYSAVPVGKDRAALSRAAVEGVGVAGRLLAEMDLDDARLEIAAFRTDFGNLKAEHAKRIAKLEEELMALRRDGAAAAARGDTAGLLAGLGELRDLLAQTNNQQRK